jgi:predicted Rdx family selenoprotein
MDILSTAGSYVGQTTSVIENKALGDAFQIMVSANGKVLHGSNRADGWRARQVGGYMDGETLRQLSRDMLRSLAPINNDVQHQERTQDVPTAESESQRQTEFMERYGKGFKVASKSPDR